jgi:hypothetical protein
MTQTLARRHVAAGPDLNRSLFALAILGLAACSDPMAPHPLAQRNLVPPCGVVTLCAIPLAKFNPLPKAYMDSLGIIRRGVNQKALLAVGDTAGFCQCSTPPTSAPVGPGKP